MTLLSFDELWNKLISSDESVEIEAKRGTDIGDSLLETISAFSNEPDNNGGYLLLGVSTLEDSLYPDYKISGIRNSDQLQTTLATRCRNEFNIAVRPVISVETRNGKTVIIAFIPEAQPSDKPVFIKRKGLAHGAFRRIGSTDQKCTEDDIAFLHQLRSHKTFDTIPITGTTLNDVDGRTIKEYRRSRQGVNPTATELSYDNDELLDSLSATALHKGDRCMTIAGMLLFGKPSALRREFPMTRVDYMRVEGREWMADPEHRYVNAIEYREPLLLMIPRIIGQILEDIPKTFSLPEGSIYRKDIPLIPYRVIREAVVNALMHRDYRVHGATQIVRYSNRLEIINPGYSLISEERLGEPGLTRTRNPKIASVLHDVDLAETKGTGIRTMREQMEQANLTTPLFVSDRQKDTFTVSLFTVHFLEEDDVHWLRNFKQCRLSDEEARALVFLRKAGQINNATFRSINRGIDMVEASRALQRLRDLELIETRSKGAGTFYVPATRFLVAENKSAANIKTNPTDKSLSGRLNPPYKRLSVGFPGLPLHLAEAVEKLGKRATPEEVKYVILKLCKWRALQVTELSIILNRSRRYTQENYLSPMIKSGDLRYTYPDNPAHPQQAYKVGGKSKKKR
jgi:ATP-dependent DNA helicase RecG